MAAIATPTLVVEHCASKWTPALNCVPVHSASCEYVAGSCELWTIALPAYTASTSWPVRPASSRASLTAAAVRSCRLIPLISGGSSRSPNRVQPTPVIATLSLSLFLTMTSLSSSPLQATPAFRFGVDARQAVDRRVAGGRSGSSAPTVPPDETGHPWVASRKR